MRDGKDEKKRLARYLAGDRGQVRPSASRERLLVQSGDRPPVAVAAATIALMAREGLLTLEADTVRLTASGLSLRQRGEAPGDPFLAQHRLLQNVTIDAPEGRRQVAVNIAESPLTLIARRKGRDGRPFLSSAELAAGERLRSDFTRGQVMPRLGANWEAAVSGGRRSGGAGGQAELTETALSARLRVERALNEVGPELSGVLIDICCFLKGLETVEAERLWPVRSAKIILKAALGALARHYDPEPGRRVAGRGTILHWGSEDYRPTL